jgi:hypothetical protein
MVLSDLHFLSALTELIVDIRPSRLDTKRTKDGLPSPHCLLNMPTREAVRHHPHTALSRINDSMSHINMAMAILILAICPIHTSMSDLALHSVMYVDLNMLSSHGRHLVGRAETKRVIRHAKDGPEAGIAQILEGNHPVRAVNQRLQLYGWFKCLAFV